MNKVILLLLLVCACTQLAATNLWIENATLYFEGTEANRNLYVIADVSWDNAWRNTKNHDAAWLFVKLLTGNGYRHILVSDNGHAVITNYTGKQKLALIAADDKVGIYLRSDDAYRGKIRARIRIQLDAKSLGNINPNNGLLLMSGIEMVYIPAGIHYLGEPDSAMSRKYYSLHGTSAGNKYDFHVIRSEDEIPVNKETGSLYYNVETPMFQGDQQGPVPAAFPKGYGSFYLMKYEITQGEYAVFLNSLSHEQSQLRANFGGKDYYKNRGSISNDNGKYVAAFPNRPCNYLSWDDAMAYADWAGLRPYTELEFNKACLGPVKPGPNQYPWGNTSRNFVERAVDANGDLVLQHEFTEAQLSEGNLEAFGASYFWVMDLAGSVWERVVTVGDQKGRAFKGTQGDGTVSYYGFANNEDWPKGTVETGGYGFRGGGFYTYGKPFGEFNAYSPVSYRPFGAWSGGNRSEAYGSRFARSGD